MVTRTAGRGAGRTRRRQRALRLFSLDWVTASRLRGGGTLFTLLEQAVERRARIARISGCSDIRRWCGVPVRVPVAVQSWWMHRFARYGETRFEQRTLVGLVLHRNPYWYWLQTLEPGGRLKIRTLLAAVQSDAALRAFAFEVDIGKKSGGAIEASCRSH